MVVGKWCGGFFAEGEAVEDFVFQEKIVIPILCSKDTRACLLDPLLKLLPMAPKHQLIEIGDTLCILPNLLLGIRIQDR